MSKSVFYASSWMCHTSWAQVILINSAQPSSWPLGWIQPLCEVCAWPITFSLQETGSGCSFSKHSLLHLCSLGSQWQAQRGIWEGRGAQRVVRTPTQLPRALPPGQPQHSRCVSPSCTLIRVVLCAWKARSSLTNRILLLHGQSKM